MTTSFRNLSVIMFTDIKGFSSRMGANEEQTYRLLQQHNTIIHASVEQHGGRVIKTIGDAFMAEFSSAIEATRSALKIQQSLVEFNAERTSDEKLKVRIGLHLGDVIKEKDGDLFGDGVNIASRLEGQSPPGGICLSGSLYEEVRKKLPEITFVRAGALTLKNIAHPVEAYFIPPADASDDEQKVLHPYDRVATWKEDFENAIGALFGQGAFSRVFSTYSSLILRLPSFLQDFSNPSIAASKKFRSQYLGPAVTSVVGFFIILALTSIMDALTPGDSGSLPGGHFMSGGLLILFVLSGGALLSLISRKRMLMGSALGLCCYIQAVHVGLIFLVVVICTILFFISQLAPTTGVVIGILMTALLSFGIAIAPLIQAWGFATMTGRLKALVFPVAIIFIYVFLGLSIGIRTPGPMVQLGSIICKVNGMPDCAEKLSALSVELAPGNEKVWSSRLDTVFQRGDKEELQRLAQRGIKQMPQSAWMRYYLAEACWPQEPECAINSMRTALALDPTFDIAGQELAYMLWLSNHYDEALEFCSEVTTLNRFSPEIIQSCHWISGRIWYSKKAVAKAVKEFELVENLKMNENVRYIYSRSVAAITMATYLEWNVLPIFVLEVFSGTKAQELGIKPGDILQSLGSQQPTTAKQWSEALRNRPSKMVHLSVLRRDGSHEIIVPPEPRTIGIRLDSVW